MFLRTDTEQEKLYPTAFVSKDRWYKAGVENQRSREGIRGVHSTDEVSGNGMEGRNPALIELEERVSARA